MQKFVLAVFGSIAIGSAVMAATAVNYARTYAEDRSEIEDLQARYMFALDWQNPDVYASTFTDDGVLVWAGGEVAGHDAIVEEVKTMKAMDRVIIDASTPQRPWRRRHFITNIAVRIDGDRATGRAYWFEFNDDMRDRRPYLGAYGHYEDELRKVNGRWLFSRRQIFNEQRDNMAATDEYPAW
ncbi:MAG: nuclear transport factor 2 family protein [Gammaproteobacteria bacterium]|nr:nuclear transport factor 2 family protein [Gammaproteobacteria bacterium]